MRSVLFSLLCLLLTGCATLPIKGHTPPNLFHDALVQLVDGNKPAAMQALADDKSSPLAPDARLVIKLNDEAHSRNTETAKQLATLREENRQLKETLDKLSRLHLDLDRRSP